VAQILFLLRAAPGIDHLVPVIQKLCSETNHKIKLIGIDIFYDYSQDERINLVQNSYDLNLFSLYEKLPIWLLLAKRIYFSFSNTYCK
jgi:hypothetical protein